MSRGEDNQFAALRLALDEAITYGSLQEAGELARRGVRLAGEKALPGEAEYFSGQVDMLSERYTEAIEHFDQAVRHNPGDGAAYNDRALCMVEMGIIDQALPYFDKGIAVEPDYATVYHNKGWLLNKIGRHSEAIACFKKALELEPQRAVTYENLADTLYNLSDYQGAKAAYEKAIAVLDPKYRGIKRQLLARLASLKEK